MWQLRTIKPSHINPITLNVIGVNNWTFNAGLKAGSGHYLSPSNAVNYLMPRICDETIIFMVTSKSQSDFLGRLASLSRVFPHPVITQSSRIAQASFSLDETKMIVPEPYKSAGLEKLSVETLRELSNKNITSLAIKDAEKNISISRLKAELSMLAANLSVASEQAKHEKIITSTAWVFDSNDGDYVMESIPEDSFIYTAAILLNANNLDKIRKLII